MEMEVVVMKEMLELLIVNIGVEVMAVVAGVMAVMKKVEGVVVVLVLETDMSETVKVVMMR